MSRAFFLAALLAVAQAYIVPLEQLPSYTFEQYLKDFNLDFPSRELPARRLMFKNELARVLEHNSKNVSWKEGMNKFSVLTAEEKKQFLGRNKYAAANKNLLSAKPAAPSFPMKPLDQLPAAVDWRTKGVVSTVKDQGHCGSCWAFASTAVIESHVAIASGLLYELSVQQMAMCAPNANHCGGTGGCDGSTAELAFSYVTTTSRGLLQEYQMGYDSYSGENYNCSLPTNQGVATIGGFTKLTNNNALELMNALVTQGPIAVNVDASTWSAYRGGVFDGCGKEQLDINHVVVLVGYGTDAATGQAYWLVRNSWSAHWGEQGYIRLARYADDDQRCAVDTTPLDGVACAGDVEPVQVCGTCGIVYDSSYPNNARAF